MQHDVNCLKDTDRNIRRTALQRLSQSKISEPSDLTLLLKPLLGVFSDQIEKNRELAVALAIQLFSQLVAAKLPDVISDISSTISERLAPPVLVEQSEEVRLSLLTLLQHVVDIVESDVDPKVVENIVLTLERSVQDVFPDAKKLSCAILVRMCKKGIALLDGYIPALVQALMVCLGHQQAKVRSSALEALAVCLPCHTADPSKLLREVVPQLRRLTDDRATLVREELMVLAAYWVGAIHEDESCWLLPILLAGVSDDMPGVRDVSLSLMQKSGDLYLSRHPEAAEESETGPQNSFKLYGVAERGGTGARVMVQRHLDAILKPMIADMGEWTATQRWKAVDVVSAAAYYAERAVGAHAEILAPLARALADDDKKVSDRAVICAEVLGVYFPIETSVAVASAALRGTTLTHSIRSKWLLLLSVFLSAARTHNPNLIKSELEHRVAFDGFIGIFTDDENANSDSHDVQEALLGCVTALIAAGGPACLPYSQPLFNSLLRLQSLHLFPDISAKAKEVSTRLSEVLGLDPMVLYAKHSDALLRALLANHKQWHSGSTDVALFSTLVAGAASVDLVVGALPVFREAANPARDADVRVQLLVLLKKISDDSSGEIVVGLRGHTAEIISKILIPCSVWHVGRVSVAIRKAAVAVLRSFLVRVEMIEVSSVGVWFPSALPQWTSILEDDDSDIRFLSCQISTSIFTLLKGNISESDCRTIWIELLKRLDDSNDRIRIEAAASFTAFLPSLPKNYDSGQYDYLVRGMVVHLDDSNEEVQNAMQPPLQQAALISPTQFISIVMDVKPKHRTPYRCDDLITFAKSL